MKLGAREQIRQGRVQESQREEQEQSHQIGLHSSSSGGMEQVKCVPQRRAEGSIFNISSQRQGMLYFPHLVAQQHPGTLIRLRVKSDQQSRLKKHKALSQSVMFHERIILHTSIHVHFYFRGSSSLPNSIVSHATWSSCTAHLNLQQLL